MEKVVYGISFVIGLGLLWASFDKDTKNHPKARQVMRIIGAFLVGIALAILIFA